MRILYDDKLATAGLTATNEDANFPIARISDGILTSEFRAISDTSTITAVLAEQATISALALGNHNLSTLQVTITKADLSTVVLNYTVNDLRFSSDDSRKMLYFTPVPTVTQIVFAAVGLQAPLFIGALAAGQYLQAPPFSIEPDIGFKLTGGAQKSRYGVAFGVDGVKLETFKASFGGVTITDYDAVNAFIFLVRSDQTFWLDRWEDSTEFPYLHCQLTSKPRWKKAPQGIVFNNLSLEFEECN